MNNRLSSEEKRILVNFQNMRIPMIFKNDKTDRILFVENLNFVIRTIVLRNRKIPPDLYDEIMGDYERFVKNSDISDFDKYAFDYYTKCVRIVEMIKNY